jgi:hypothetical protein
MKALLKKRRVTNLLTNAELNFTCESNFYNFVKYSTITLIMELTITTIRDIKRALILLYMSTFASFLNGYTYSITKNYM